MKYAVIDIQDNEIIADNFDLDDLREFANDLYWDDLYDFSNSDIKNVCNAICACDYEIKEVDNK